MGSNRRPDPPEKKIGAITADMVIQAFVKTRDLIAEKKKAFKLEEADLKVVQQKRANWLKGQMDALGVESMKSVKHGTAFIDWKDSASVADWPAFIKWVKDEEQYDFLNHAVNKTAVKQQLDEGKPLPPGVNYSKIKDVKVRRA